ncbi:uncharacterized protein LOC118435616 [Folsomia candida]|uniref:Uncharacterized protein n=1 Tax=Folsomia candida TaxID=158441 RepID=A0A226ECS6_FOLCA|nr:uncharacterized protein LOC118435616 [Folsomia candida]OXA54914.1 hypothetical protein Fcan01_10930 [Folsomia candida]
MSILEKYYCCTSKSFLVNSRGRPYRNRFLPPYLRNSELIVRLPGHPHNKYTQTAPYICSHPSVGHRNVNRIMTRYVEHQKRACVQDEDGNFWFRGSLAAEKERKLSAVDSGISETSTDEGSQVSKKDRDGAVSPDLGVYSNSDEIVDIDDELYEKLTRLKIADMKFCRKRPQIRNYEFKNWNVESVFGKLV